MAEVMGHHTSRDVWTALEEALSHSSLSRVNYLRGELFNLRHGTSTVEEYNRRFHILCEQLASIGCPVDATNKSHWFLNGLGSQFLSFSDTHMSMSPMPPFRDLVHQAITFNMLHRSMEALAAAVPAFATARRLDSNQSRRSTEQSCVPPPSGNSGGFRGSSGSGGFQPDNSSKGKKKSMFLIVRFVRNRVITRIIVRRAAHSPYDSANLAQAFESQCFISPSHMLLIGFLTRVLLPI
ncbi:hypothetical protein ACS0TY_031988 [Phlomoides rotata]